MIQTHNFSSIKDKIIQNQNDGRKDVKDITTLNQSEIRKAPVKMLIHFFYIISRLVKIVKYHVLGKFMPN